MSRFLATALLLALPAAQSIAAPAESILVLDASGSMWGQIQGRTKIELAREAVAGMLDGWQGGALGLMAYGHRRKGDCNDIELLIEPGRFDAGRLRTQVNALSPMGMTPISAAVRQAAEALRYTEQKATVILVSDGEETCQADPCALGAELERQGIDFTAHVIGFDIPAGGLADTQLRCLAERTGGRYVKADTASELNQALDAVSDSPAATISAREGRDWMPGYALEAEVGTTLDGEAQASTGNHDFSVDQRAEDCQALCAADAGCGGWHYEPAGSYFIDHPRCHLKSGTFAVRLREEGEGWVAGIKPGVKLVLDEQAGE